MKALIRGLTVLIVIFCSIWLIRSYQPDMTIVYPDQCSFTIDAAFSKSYQYEIKQFIDGQYQKTKDPKGLLISVESQFDGVKAISVNMNNPDFLQFNVRSYKPLFMLNDRQVACQEGLVLDKSIFSVDQLAQLESIEYKLPEGALDLQKLTRFVESIDPEIIRKFSIRWLGKHQVWLDQKEGSDLALLVSYTIMPTLHDVKDCLHIKNQMQEQDKKQKDITWVCDLRFGKQIVVFSTKKGG